MDSDAVKAFFRQTAASIRENRQLREPQRDAWVAISEHIASGGGPSYIQLPVGCGKTGVMGIAPFGVSNGRVLIVAPNITVRDTILSELDISKPDCFYSKRGVFIPINGPYLSVLKTGANIHDCDNAHIVVANIQQFVGKSNKWYERLPADYFHMILVDEGHHNVAESWRRLFDYFSSAQVISFTATPVRSDGQQVEGKKIYSYTYTRAMLMGFISPIDAVYVAPAEVSFSAEGQTKTIPLADVLEMREFDWFSKGIALSEECNRHIVQASIKQLTEVKRHGTPRQIIAAACSIRHAKQILALYHEYGLRAEVLHSKLAQEERERVEAALRQGIIDVIVQVQMLGEGYDLGTLSVAAVFRPYRSLSPFIQFIGRILRLANPAASGSLANKVYVVSHVGLNDERWWTDFRNFDKEDQALFAEILEATEGTIEDSLGSPRMTLRPFMRVLSETVDKYLQQTYLSEINDAMITEFMDTIRSKGFDPIEFGLTEEMVRNRLQLAAIERQEVLPFFAPVQPQRRKEALRMRIQQEARSIADVVINRLGLKHGGRDLLLKYPGRGASNAAILITLAQKAQNEVMGISTGQRESASVEQFQVGLDASANLADRLTGSIKAKLAE
jgi:superfamily II DNA or RNA helicase